MRKILFFILSFILISGSLLGSTGMNDQALAQTHKESNTTIYLFWGDGCPYCVKEKAFLQDLTQKYPDLEVKMYETWKNKDNAELFKNMASAYEIEARGAPTTFIGDFNPIVGFKEAKEDDIENKIKHCVEESCIDPGEKADFSKESLDQGVRLATSESIEDIESDNHSDTCVHLFHKEDCPQCENISGHLTNLEQEHNIKIHKYNVDTKSNKKIYETFKEKYGLTTGAYPIAFIGGKYFIGDDSIENNLEEEVVHCENNSCPCPAETIKGFTPYLPQSENVTQEEKETIEVPMFGTINLSNFSIYGTTSIIAFVDGFNPCSLWLITFLLGIVIHSKSRKKILAVGATFLLVTGGVYALFMAGLVNVFQYVGYMNWIQAIIAGVALIFAIVNIKDYFWYKQGISFTISDKYKPKIFKNIRNIMHPQKTIWGTIIGTAILALGVVLVELPCTAGFPLIWSGMIAQQGISGSTFGLLLLIYMIIYLLDEILVVGVIFWTMKITRFEEKHGRILKLIGGMIMLALGGVMAINPDLMNDAGSAVIIFVIAIGASFMIMWLHRKILPSFGIYLGTEKNLKQDNKSEDK